MIPNIILGPPGTGKTTRLIEIVEEELDNGVAPHEIAYVSFTREGAEQGRSRAMKTFGYASDEFPFFRTLHSLAFQETGLDASSVISKKDYKIFSDKMGMNFTGYYTEDLRHDDDMYLFFDEIYRNNPKAASSYLSILDAKKLQFVRNNYRRFKEEARVIDYTDMIEEFCRIGAGVPVRVAIIDEAQDLTTLQWKMVFIAFKYAERMYIAGDDDQAVYQWSGADVDYFLGLEGKIEVLRHSYRLPDAILQYAKTITSQITHRKDKEYEGTGVLGRVEEHNIVSEVEINKNETYMFLSRNNTFLKEIENFVMTKGVIYRKRGVVSAKKADYDAIKLYEEGRSRILSEDEKRKIKPYLKSRYNEKAPWFDSFDWDPNRLLYFRDLVSNKVSLKEVNVSIGTIHSVKGGEADNVVILLDITRNVMINVQKNPDCEHRVFYVGCTRAKKTLHIVRATGRYEYGMYSLRRIDK